MREPMKTFFRNRGTFSALGLATLLLCSCKQEQKEGYSRLETVPGPEAAPAAPAASAPAQGGADPHAGLFPSATDTTAPAAGAMNIPTVPNAPVRIGGNVVEVAGVAFTVPETWKNEPPANRFRVAQFSLPGEAGPAELVFSYFGKGQGGSIEDNVRRWAGQFTSDDPTTSALGADVAEFESDGLRVALVKTSGTYNPGMMAAMSGGSAEPRPNYALFGMVIEGAPQGTVFVKATGPKATIEAQEENLTSFARSVRPSNYK